MRSYLSADLFCHTSRVLDDAPRVYLFLGALVLAMSMWALLSFLQFTIHTPQLHLVVSKFTSPATGTVTVAPAAGIKLMRTQRSELHVLVCARSPALHLSLVLLRVRHESRHSKHLRQQRNIFKYTCTAIHAQPYMHSYLLGLSCPQRVSRAVGFTVAMWQRNLCTRKRRAIRFDVCTSTYTHNFTRTHGPRRHCRKNSIDPPRHARKHKPCRWCNHRDQKSGT
jgi:hypothetical protein